MRERERRAGESNLFNHRFIGAQGHVRIYSEWTRKREYMNSPKLIESKIAKGKLMEAHRNRIHRRRTCTQSKLQRSVL